MSAIIEERATRFLARHAYKEGAISPICFEFILDEPDRCDEVLEFTRWLAGAPVSPDDEVLG